MMFFAYFLLIKFDIWGNPVNLLLKRNLFLKQNEKVCYIMKIACPVCNQHFDVEANMLDRYFRCTECKTLFLGLNAKLVKEPKFVRKSEVDGAEENVAENEFSGEAAVDAEASESAEQSSGVQAGDNSESPLKTTPIEVFGEIFDLNKDSEPEEIVESVSPWKNRDFLTMTAAYTGCFAAAAALVIAVIALITGRNSAVQDDIAARELNMSTRIETIAVQVNAAADNVENIRIKVEDLQRFRDRLSNKIGAVNVETQLALLDGKLKNLESVKTELESVKKELGELKKQLPAVRQGNVRRR